MELSARTTIGLEGVYVVRPGRTLFWHLDGSEPVLWAKGKAYIDLRSPAVCQYVQRTKQMHKLVRVETVPAGAEIVSYQRGPYRIRKPFSDYEQAHAPEGFGPIPREKPKGSSVEKKAKRTPKRKATESAPMDFPSAAAPAELPLDGEEPKE